jgi:hypothetical protein
LFPTVLWCLGTGYLCVTLLLNLIYLGFREFGVFACGLRDHEVCISKTQDRVYYIEQIVAKASLDMAASTITANAQKG